MDEDPNIAYPYRLDDGQEGAAPDRRWWVRFQPVLLAGMHKRARAAATGGKPDGAADPDAMQAALWREMIADSCLPDFVLGGSMTVTPETYEKLPLYLVFWINQEIDKRNGGDLRAYRTVIRGQEADFRRATGTPGSAEVDAPVPSSGDGAGR